MDVVCDRTLAGQPLSRCLSSHLTCSPFLGLSGSLVSSGKHFELGRSATAPSVLFGRCWSSSFHPFWSFSGWTRAGRFPTSPQLSRRCKVSSPLRESQGWRRREGWCLLGAMYFLLFMLYASCFAMSRKSAPSASPPSGVRLKSVLVTKPSVRTKRLI